MYSSKKLSARKVRLTVRFIRYAIVPDPALKSGLPPRFRRRCHQDGRRVLSPLLEAPGGWPQ